MAEIDPLIQLYRERRQRDGYASLSYDDLLNTAGVGVLASATFGDYQGDTVFLVEENGLTFDGLNEDGTDRFIARRGVVVVGYGSCSGCDALEGALPYGHYDEEVSESEFVNVIALRDQIAAGIIWPEPGETLAETVERQIPDNEDNWYWGNDEILQQIREYAADDFMAPEKVLKEGTDDN